LPYQARHGVSGLIIIMMFDRSQKYLSSPLFGSFLADAVDTRSPLIKKERAVSLVHLTARGLQTNACVAIE
jgi:hypothetical protein